MAVIWLPVRAAKSIIKGNAPSSSTDFKSTAMSLVRKKLKLSTDQSEALTAEKSLGFSSEARAGTVPTGSKPINT